MSYRDILVSDAEGIRTITLNRPEAGNKFRDVTCVELLDALQRFRTAPDLRAAILTGAGEKFFCIGGEHDELHGLDYSNVLPIIDVYQAIDTIAKPIVAAVNGFAVGGGNVLHTMCDLTIAADNAVFRQVGPMVGSFDAGFGTWYLEDTIGRKRAKEMWYLNEKLTADQALAYGLVNRVVPDDQLIEETTLLANAVAERGAQALAAIKLSFAARTGGAGGFSRV